MSCITLRSRRKNIGLAFSRSPTQAGISPVWETPSPELGRRKSGLARKRSLAQKRSSDHAPSWAGNVPVWEFRARKISVWVGNYRLGLPARNGSSELAPCWAGKNPVWPGRNMVWVGIKSRLRNGAPCWAGNNPVSGIPVSERNTRRNTGLKFLW